MEREGGMPASTGTQGTPALKVVREVKEMATYLVEFVLASLGVVDRGAVPVVAKVSSRNESISACA